MTSHKTESLGVFYKSIGQRTIDKDTQHYHFKGNKTMEFMIEDLMEQVVESGGSDLHLAGLPPYIRIKY